MNTRIHESTLSAPRDFVMRQHSPGPLQLTSIFFGVFFIVFLLIYTDPGGSMTFALMTLVLVLLGLYIAYSIQQLKDLLVDAEFQNALFSSALGLNHKFLAIARSDNTITYFNQGFQDTFPKFTHQPRRTVDTLLDQCEVNAADRDKITAAVESGRHEQIVFEIFTGVGPVPVVLQVEPIMKPSGFVLVVGRDFVEPRKTQVQAPTGFR